MRPHRRGVAMLAMLALLAMAPAALADEPSRRAVFDLQLNGVACGETVVLLRGGDVLVPLRDLERAGLVRLRLERAPAERHDGEAYVSLRAASPRLRYSLDEQELVLRVDAPASMLASTQVDLASAPPPGTRYSDDFSGFVNYAPRLVDQTRFEGFGEIGVAFGPAIATSGASYDPDNGPVRLMTQLVVDDRPARRRVTIGDGLVATGPLGGSLLLGGLSLAHRLDLDPYLVTIPRLGYTGSVTAPSTVDVYVNDTLVRRVPIAPGDFRISNLVPVSGEGTARYVIRDPYGNEQRVESQYYASSGVLASGLQEYHYAAGFARQQYGSDSFAYGDLALLGRHRYGFSDAVTGGARLEAKLDTASGGVDLTIAPGFGEIEIGGAASVAEGDAENEPVAGGAGLLGWSFARAPVSLRTLVRVTSPDYATASVAPLDDRPLVEHYGSAGWAIGSRLALGAEVAYALARDASPQGRFGLHANVKMSPELNLHLSGTDSYGGEGQWQYDLRATVTVSLPWQHTGAVSMRTGSTGPEIAANVGRAVQGTTGVGYQLAGALADEERVSAALRARARPGTYDASYTYVGGEHHTLLQWAGGIAVLPGAGVFFTRPIEQSYAVVEVPGVEGVRAFRDNQPVGRTDEDGQLLVPGLLPYYGNRLSVDTADLPLDRQPADDEIVVAPPPRGGAHVVFEVERVRLVRGRVAIAQGQHWRWASLGEVRVATPDGTVTAPLGAKGELEIEGLPAGRFQATVVSAEGSCRLVLSVPEGDELIRELGVLRCGGAGKPVSEPNETEDRR